MHTLMGVQGYQPHLFTGDKRRILKQSNFIVMKRPERVPAKALTSKRKTHWNVICYTTILVLDRSNVGLRDFTSRRSVCRCLCRYIQWYRHVNQEITLILISKGRGTCSNCQSMQQFTLCHSSNLWCDPPGLLPRSCNMALSQAPKRLTFSWYWQPSFPWCNMYDIAVDEKWQLVGILYSKGRTVAWIWKP